MKSGTVHFLSVTFLLVIAVAMSAVTIYMLWHVYKTTDDIYDSLSITSTTPLVTTTTGPHNVSHTQGWKDAAAFIKASLNESVDPCTDFFQFSCGGWIAAHPLKPEQMGIDVFTVSLIETITAVKDMLVRVNETDLKIMQAMKNYYNSCVESSFEQTTNRDALVDTLTKDKKFIGFPMILNYWQSPGWNAIWKFMAAVEINHGVGSLFQSYVGNDMGRPERNALYLYQANVAFARVQYVNPYYADVVETYRQFIIDAGKILAKHANQTLSEGFLAQLESDANDVVALETRLAYISRSGDDQRNFSRTYNPYQMDRMMLRWPNMNWTAYFSTVLGPIGFSESQQVVVNQPAYLDALNGLLKDPTPFSTDQLQRVVVNFINWRFVYDNTDFLYDEEFSNALLNFKRAVYGVENLPPSELGCTYKLTDTFLPLPMGRLYVEYRMKKENLTETRDSVKDQTTRIVNAFLKRVQNLEWMDDESKANAAKKANNLVENIGYPDWILDDVKLESVYANWSAGFKSGKGSAFWSNIQFAKRQQMLDQLDQLGKPTDRHSFGGSGPTAANAWYQPRANSITYALAILQSPFWRYDFPQAINYGNQGGTAGHELTHGYDDSGVQFYLNGTLHTWVDAKSLAGFESMAQCVIGQYSSHCCPKGVHGMCANGVATQGENIADVGGQAASYDAYIDYVEQSLGHEEPRMPGLEQYNMRQMFWISYAHTWCGVYRPKALVQQLLTDPHAPDTCRTNLVLRDLSQFGKDFNCKYGVDFMYPKKEEICVVW